MSNVAAADNVRFPPGLMSKQQQQADNTPTLKKNSNGFPCAFPGCLSYVHKDWLKQEFDDGYFIYYGCEHPFGKLLTCSMVSDNIGDDDDSASSIGLPIIYVNPMTSPRESILSSAETLLTSPSPTGPFDAEKQQQLLKQQQQQYQQKLDGGENENENDEEDDDEGDDDDDEGDDGDDDDDDDGDDGDDEGEGDEGDYSDDNDDGKTVDNLKEGIKRSNTASLVSSSSPRTVSPPPATPVGITAYGQNAMQPQPQQFGPHDQQQHHNHNHHIPQQHQMGYFPQFPPLPPSYMHHHPQQHSAVYIPPQQQQQQQQQQEPYVSQSKQLLVQRITSGLQSGRFLGTVQYHAMPSNDSPGFLCYIPVCWFFSHKECHFKDRCRFAHETRKNWKVANWTDVNWFLNATAKQIRELDDDFRHQSAIKKTIDH